MYRHPAFDVTDPAEQHQLIESSRPAHLVTSTAAGLTASVLPMILHPEVGEHGALYGHLARANPQWRDSILGAPALALFAGPNSYVSPSWYPSKQLTGKVVPTWNYITVNVHGHLVVHDDTAWLDALVRDLTGRHEAGRPEPWAVDDAPADFIEGLLKGIVGIEVRITHIEAKVKLSQNRPAEDVEGVIAGLALGDPHERAMADVMRARS